MSAALHRAAKEGNLLRGSASAGARSRRWAELPAPDTRVSASRPRAHRGTWRTALAARNSRLGLAPPARVLAPGLRRSKHANGIRKTPSFTANAPCTDTSAQGGDGSGAQQLEGTVVACNGACDVGPHPITRSFSIDQVKGAGDVRGELFIQSDTVADLKGDGRGFDPAPNPSHSRVFFDLDFENGRGTMQVNPSCHAGGGCVDPLPWGKGNNVQIQTAGGRVSIAGAFTNSIHTNGPSIDFSIQVFARSGGVSFFGSRDYYPSFELTRTAGGGTQVLLNSSEVNPVCLTGICGTERFFGASR
jgi:hypothetical protein